MATSISPARERKYLDPPQAAAPAVYLEEEVRASQIPRPPSGCVAPPALRAPSPPWSLWTPTQRNEPSHQGRLRFVASLGLLGINFIPPAEKNRAAAVLYELYYTCTTEQGALPPAMPRRRTFPGGPAVDRASMAPSSCSSNYRSPRSFIHNMASIAPHIGDIYE